MIERISERQARCFLLRDEEFRRVIGVKKETYTSMLTELELAHNRLYPGKKRGPRCGLKRADMLFATLEYLREYRSYASLGVSYGVSEATIFRAVRFVEDALIKSGKFTPPGRKALITENHFEVVVIDATESRIERPKTPVKGGKDVKNRRNRQKKYYSGKKKMHTMKTQLVVEKKDPDNLHSDMQRRT